MELGFHAHQNHPGSSSQQTVGLLRVPLIPTEVWGQPKNMHF